MFAHSFYTFSKLQLKQLCLGKDKGSNVNDNSASKICVTYTNMYGSRCAHIYILRTMPHRRNKFNKIWLIKDSFYVVNISAPPPLYRMYLYEYMPMYVVVLRMAGGYIHSVITYLQKAYDQFFFLFCRTFAFLCILISNAHILNHFFFQHYL